MTIILSFIMLILVLHELRVYDACNMHTVDFLFIWYIVFCHCPKDFKKEKYMNQKKNCIIELDTLIGQFSI